MSSTTNNQEHVWGNPNGPIELIEYADYQCPYCRQAYYMLKEVKKQLGNDLKFVFRNFPIPELHAHAIHAAVVAEIAGAQDKFWEMHDTLFENQKKLDDPYLFKYAEDLGLDMKRFEEDLENESFFRKVNQDYESGIKKGVQGTPTFFINGELFNGNWMDPAFIGYLKTFAKK